MAFRHIEQLLYRLQLSRFLRLRVIRIGVLRGIRYLKHHFPDFVQIAFFKTKNVVNAFKWPFNFMKLCFIQITKVAF
jgi:hypothetical protein